MFATEDTEDHGNHLTTKDTKGHEGRRMRSEDHVGHSSGEWCVTNEPGLGTAGSIATPLIHKECANEWAPRAYVGHPPRFPLRMRGMQGRQQSSTIVVIVNGIALFAYGTGLTGWLNPILGVVLTGLAIVY